MSLLGSDIHLRSNAAKTVLRTLRFLLESASLDAYVESTSSLCLAVGKRLCFRLRARGPTMTSLPTGLLRCPGVELLSAVACSGGVRVCIRHARGVGPPSIRFLDFQCPHCSNAKGTVSRCVRWKGQLCIVESRDDAGFWRIRLHSGIVRRTKDPLAFVDERLCKCQHFRGDQGLFRAGRQTFKVLCGDVDPGVDVPFTQSDGVQEHKADCLGACLGSPVTCVPPATTLDQSPVDWGLAPTADSDDSWEDPCNDWEDAQSTVDWGLAPTADTDDSWVDPSNDWEDDHVDSDGVDEFGHMMDVLGCMQPEL